MIITISGPPGSGTSTLKDNLEDVYDCHVISGGKIFRKMAQDKGLTLSELTKKAENNESIDNELDERIEKYARDFHMGNIKQQYDHLIVESRLSAWLAPEEAYNIWLTASSEERCKRVDDRKETVQELKDREQSERSRYIQMYGVDIEDYNLYDLMINTEYHSVDETCTIARTGIETRL